MNTTLRLPSPQASVEVRSGRTVSVPHLKHLGRNARPGRLGEGDLIEQPERAASVTQCVLGEHDLAIERVACNCIQGLCQALSGFAHVPAGSWHRDLRLTGGREEIRRESCAEALGLLAGVLRAKLGEQSG